MNKKRNFFFIFLIAGFFVSCKSMDEIKIVNQIKHNNSVDLAICCDNFDEIVIYDEGRYYEHDKNNYPGTKIYYFNNGKVEKIINLHYCADEPFGSVIYFSDYNDGVIKRHKGDTLFYVSRIHKYSHGKIFFLCDEQVEVKVDYKQF